MKLGVSYIVFDGVDLLEWSIRPIREHIDYLQVIYQRVSWFGKEMSLGDLSELNRLVDIGLIDELTEFRDFKPLTTSDNRSIMTAKGYETRKRSVGLQSCVSNGCTHYLCMDSDEFYKAHEFSIAKNYIIENNIGQSAVKFVNYVNTPTLHRGFDKIYVPFICMISRNARMGKRFIVPCDPTRGVNIDIPTHSHIFNPSVIHMHHMETVRKDLLKKYESTTRSIFNRNKTKELVKHIESVDDSTQRFSFNRIIAPRMKASSLHKCENIFKIPYSTWNK